MVAVEPSRGTSRPPSGGACPTRQRHQWQIVVGASALVVVALTASISTGSWWIPHNDDWAFTRIAERFAQTGDTSLIGWNNMNVPARCSYSARWERMRWPDTSSYWRGPSSSSLLLLGRPGTSWPSGGQVSHAWSW